jgi:hypothetical protein
MPTSLPTAVEEFEPRAAQMILNTGSVGDAVETARSVRGSGPFSVGVDLPTLPAAYAGVQVEFAFPPDGLAVDAQLKSENPTLSTCVPLNVNPSLVPMRKGDMVYGQGGGCLGLGANVKSTAVGRLLDVEVHCVSNGSFVLTLVGTDEDPVFGSTIFLEGGVQTSVRSTSVTIDCSDVADVAP